MRILLSKEDMKTCDQNTIEGFGVPSCVLMERAALACVDELYRSGAALDRVLVICGSGNNGGDGFAIARLLFLDQVPVSIWFVGKEQSCTDQTRHQKEICEKYGITFCSNPEINEYTVIVDALFESVFRVTSKAATGTQSGGSMRVLLLYCLSIFLPALTETRV